MGEIFEVGSCATALSFVRGVDFFDIIFLAQDEECPAFFELFCVIGELKPDAQVVVACRVCGGGNSWIGLARRLGLCST
jgi:uncharacterized protein YerC